MNEKFNIPRVGLGVLIFNEHTEILLGQRLSSHGIGFWCPPGGHLDFGESFEMCAIREVKEETGLVIDNPIFLAVTNDVFLEEKKHYISIFMQANYPKDQEVVNQEPHKTSRWEWFNVHSLPQQLFLPLQHFMEGIKYE